MTVSSSSLKLKLSHLKTWTSWALKLGNPVSSLKFHDPAFLKIHHSKRLQEKDLFFEKTNNDYSHMQQFALDSQHLRVQLKQVTCKFSFLGHKKGTTEGFLS